MTSKVLNIQMLLATSSKSGVGDKWRRPSASRVLTCYRRVVKRPPILGTVLPFGISVLSLQAADWTISLTGAGPVRLGMSVSAVRRVLGDAGAQLAGNESDVPLSDCAYLESKRIPQGLGLMFAKGRLVRIDIIEGPTKTSNGAGIGDSEDRIKQLYAGRIKVEPHVYVDEGHYLNYVPVGRSNVGIVFETDGQQVTSFRVGTFAAIALIEGCS
jgi:hypothetical protein